jgi:hypothetical protein
VARETGLVVAAQQRPQFARGVEWFKSVRLVVRAGNVSQEPNFAICILLKLQLASGVQTQCVAKPLGDRNPSVCRDSGFHRLAS